MLWQNSSGYITRDKANSIYAMFKSGIQSLTAEDPFWTNESNSDLLKQFGTLKSFTFLCIDKTESNVYVFQTFFSNAGAKTTNLTLYENSRLGTFRFITTSEGIDALFNKRNN